MTHRPFSEAENGYVRRMAELLTLTNVEKHYDSSDGPVAVLQGVSLALSAGETLALTGESGSGKSTLLHISGALDSADAGTVRLAGQDLVGLNDSARARIRRDHLGFVFQQFNLIPSLSVADNIALPARLANRQDRAFEAHLVARLGLEALIGRYPEQLSGGQQQRVAIARALSARPALILADEPTGNLDEDTGDAVLDLLLELTQETQSGLLMVTHSPRLAARLSRRVHLSRGQLQRPGQAA